MLTLGRIRAMSVEVEREHVFDRGECRMYRVVVRDFRERVGFRRADAFAVDEDILDLIMLIRRDGIRFVPAPQDGSAAGGGDRASVVCR